MREDAMPKAAGKPEQKSSAAEGPSENNPTLAASAEGGGGGHAGAAAKSQILHTFSHIKHRAQELSTSIEHKH
jgi:hypothetical protein